MRGVAGLAQQVPRRFDSVVVGRHCGLGGSERHGGLTVAHHPQDVVVRLGGEQHIERRQDSVSVAQRRQLVRCRPHRPVERSEVVAERRLDESRESADRLASLAYLVDDRFEVGLGIGTHLVEAFDGVVESLCSNAAHLPLHPPAGFEHVRHVTK